MSFNQLTYIYVKDLTSPVLLFTVDTIAVENLNSDKGLKSLLTV